MIKKISGIVIAVALGFVAGVFVEKHTSYDNQYVGAKKLVSDCQRELKRSQQCVLIAVEDEPESAANDKLSRN